MKTKAEALWYIIHRIIKMDEISKCKSKSYKACQGDFMSKMANEKPHLWDAVDERSQITKNKMTGRTIKTTGRQTVKQRSVA